MLLGAVIFLALFNLKHLSFLLKSKRKKEMAVFILLTLCNVVLSALVLMDVKFITPQQLLDMMMNRLFGKPNF